MKSFLKKLIASAMAFAIIITPVATASAAELTSEIDVTVLPTLIDVTITPSITLPVLDPNAPMYSTGLSKINIQNNSKAPVKVTLVDFALAAGSDFNLVSPDKYTAEQWGKLNKAQSKDIALKLEWQGWKSASADYYCTGTGDSFVGTIDPNSIASMKVFNVYTGRSHDSMASATFDVIFVVELE